MSILEIVLMAEAPAIEAARIREHREQGFELLNAKPTRRPRLPVPRRRNQVKRQSAPPRLPKPEFTERLEFPLDESAAAISARVEQLRQIAAQRREVAIKIALEARVLIRCPAHGCLFDGQRNPARAYRHANALLSAGDHRVAVFDGTYRRELTDCIKAAIDEHGTACPKCAR